MQFWKLLLPDASPWLDGPRSSRLAYLGVLAPVCLLTQALTYSALVFNVTNILGFRRKAKHSAEL